MPDTVHVTFFKDFYATRYTTADLTLEELRTRILTTSAKNKDSLPWLKLAIFGKKKIPGSPDGKSSGCLRWDGNVQQITGAELDYDGMQIGFDQGLEMVRAMGINALVYTSPRHTASAPRWRILAPTSQPCPPELREKLVARMNGAMHGILGKHVESFTLSQSYYYGRSEENSNANHMAIVVEGKYIDLCDELYKYQEKGFAKDGFAEMASEQPDRPEFRDGVHGFEAILGEIGDDDARKGFNDVLSRAAASYISLHKGNPFDVQKLKNLLRDAINEAPKGRQRDPRDIKRYLSDKYLDDIIATATRKFVAEMPINIRDFIAFLPEHSYIFTTLRSVWVGASLNIVLPPVPRLDQKGRPLINQKKGTQRTEKPTDWLDKNSAVHQMTWAPGEPMLIKDKLVIEGAGWIRRKGSITLNLYIPPTLSPGDPRNVLPWTSHIERVYPDSRQHIIQFLAHLVQYPEIKINHALLLGGNQGIGKDTILEPVKRSVGPWNCAEVDPGKIFDKFNPFLRSVMLRINEARDLGDVNRYAFYEHMKKIAAAPPDTLRINEKNMKEYSIINCCGVIMTTNYKTDGIYLPPDDRRTYVAWSYSKKEDFSTKYWDDLWEWYNRANGDANVMAYLGELDLSDFKAKSPPPHTEAFYAIVNSNRPTEDAEMADVLDQLDKPDALILDQLEGLSFGPFQEWIMDRKNRRAIPHRLESLGYNPVRNPTAKDGQWVIFKQRKNVYAKLDLPLNSQLDAVRELIKRLEGEGPPDPKKGNVFNLRPL